MFKLLPPQEKKHLYREYLLRLTVVTLLFIFFAQVVGVISLLPGFFLSRVKEDQIVLEQKILGEVIESEKDVNLAEDIKRARTQIEQLTIASTTIGVGRLFDVAIVNRPQGVKIHSFNLSRSANGEGQLLLGGVAPTRDSLVLFRDSLEREALFSSVELPVSDLAHSKDITFTLRIGGAF